MGRTDRLGQTQLIRVVRDVLVVVGAMPKVWRVLDTKPGTVTGFAMEPVDGEYFDASQRWPMDLFKPEHLIYSAAVAIPADLLKPVDVLHIWYGASKFVTSGECYALWQAASQTPLGSLTLMQARDALRSPWVQRQRSLGRTDSHRGITLRD